MPAGYGKEWMRIIRFTVLVGFLLATARGLQAQQTVGDPPTTSARPASDFERRMTEYLSPYVKMDHFAGVALVAKEDSILAHRAFGLADRALGVEFTTDMRLRIGSISKDFTAALVLALQDEGLLSTDDSIARFLPEFPAGERIRVRHLLEHTHGVPNWRGLPEADRLEATGVSIEEAVDILAEQPLEFEPGTERRYGSSSYLMLARIAELVTGEPYEVALRKRILDPLGLDDTGSLRGLEIVPRLAEAYVPSGFPPWLRRADPTHPAITVGSASVYTTARDLLTWSTSQPAERLGWGEARQHGREMEWTSGLTAGFVARVHRFPEGEVTLILLSNIFSPTFRPILHDLAGLVFGEEIRPPDVWEPVMLTADQRDAISGRWTCEQGFTEFEIADADGELLFVIGDARLPFVPRAPNLLHLPTDYGALTFEDAGPDGFMRARYEGGFTATCKRG